MRRDGMQKFIDKADAARASSSMVGCAHRPFGL
jgi:hypothetical protein